MPIFQVLQLLFRPRSGWQAIKAKDYGIFQALVGHTVPFALIPPVCGYLGTTRTGWHLSAAGPVKLTTASALPIAVLFYFALIVGVLSVAWAIHWMARTYGARQSFATGLVLATMTATPLFLVGFAQLYPELWLNLVLGLPALAWTVALFYSGVPIMLEVPEERGFLLASAVLAFGMTVLVALLATTVLMWGAGFAPSFTR